MEGTTWITTREEVQSSSECGIQSREHPPGLEERNAVIDSSPMSRDAPV